MIIYIVISVSIMISICIVSQYKRGPNCRGNRRLSFAATHCYCSAVARFQCQSFLFRVAWVRLPPPRVFDLLAIACRHTSGPIVGRLALAPWAAMDLHRYPMHKIWAACIVAHQPPEISTSSCRHSIIHHIVLLLSCSSGFRLGSPSPPSAVLTPPPQPP